MDAIFNNLNDRESFEYQLKRDAQEQSRHSGIAADNKRVDAKFKNLVKDKAGGALTKKERRRIHLEKNRERKSRRRRQHNARVAELAKQHKHSPPNKKKNKTRKENRHREAYVAYLASPEWKERRIPVLVRDGHKCVECSSTKNLHVHHIHYRTLGCESGNELVTLCKPCHFVEHKRHKLKDREDYWRKRITP